MPNFSKSVPDLGQMRQIKFISSFLILKEKIIYKGGNGGNGYSRKNKYVAG